MPRIKFAIGDLFRPDDPLSMWILGMALIMNDTILVNRHLIDALAKQEGSSPEGMYFLRLAASHYREAAKFQAQWDRWPLVAAFISALPPELRADYEAFHGSYDPWPGSFVEAVLK